MKGIKYFYESYENRSLPEDKQGYAEIIPIPAKEKNLITDHLISASLRDKKKIKVDFGAKSFELNLKYCPKVFNVTDPLTGDFHKELSIKEIYENGQFSELYEELSNATGDVSKLKEGIKKN
jgi:hypothetical protein